VKHLLATILLVSAAFVSAAFAAPIDEARALFDQYVQLEQAFDPSVSELYAEDALIRNKRTYPTGQVRELSIPAPQYKALIRQAMPLAKARSDANSYSKVTFALEGAGVRIHAMRFSHLKKYTSPLSMLVAPNEAGQWLIREELSESQP
jgi:hypothetical protein